MKSLSAAVVYLGMMLGATIANAADASANAVIGDTSGGRVVGAAYERDITTDDYHSEGEHVYYDADLRGPSAYIYREMPAQVKHNKNELDD